MFRTMLGSHCHNMFRTNLRCHYILVEVVMMVQIIVVGIGVMMRIRGMA